MKTIIEECGQMLPEMLGAVLALGAISQAVRGIQAFAELFIRIYT